MKISHLLVYVLLVTFLSLADLLQGGVGTVDRVLHAAETQTATTTPRVRRQLALKSCSGYEGKWIGYYHEVFFIRHCKRVPVSHKELMEYLKDGGEVEKVGASVIASLPLQGKPKLASKKKALSCSKRNGQYLAFDYENVYVMEGCRLRRFPNWISYNQHRFDRGFEQTELVFMEEEVLQAFKQGKPMPSVLEDRSSRLDLDFEEPKRALSRREACKGLEGKFVLYFSKMYKIQNCRKRHVDSMAFSRLSASKAQLERTIAQQQQQKKKKRGNSPEPGSVDSPEPGSVDSLEPGDAKNLELGTAKNSESVSDKPSRLMGASGSHSDAENKKIIFEIPEVVEITTEQWMAIPSGKAYTDLRKDFIRDL